MESEGLPLWRELSFPSQEARKTNTAATRMNFQQRANKPPQFTLPGASDRTTIIGGTGTGKTTLGAWVLSRQRFDARPWVCLDFKNEELWDLVGEPPIQELKLGKMPGKRGLYRMQVRPGEDDALEDWLWKVWSKENIGLFADEVSLIPQRNAFKAILRQGRSKRIPVISCTQRPVDCDREIFTESQFVSVFRLDDIRDYKIIQGFTRNAGIDRPLPDRWSYWYDKKHFHLSVLKPVPPPVNIASDLRRVAPYQSWFFGR
jgi:hypothetical protein